MTVSDWILVALSISAMLSLAVQSIILSRGQPRASTTHTVEEYHGNWWATWHTPAQYRAYTAAGLTGMTSVVTVCILGIMIALGIA